MRKEVIFVADDFGMNLSINQAIIHSHIFGNLHAAALMMGQEGSDDAVALARQHPSLQIGWHLHLNDSRPLTVERWPWGVSPARAGWSCSLSVAARSLVRCEIQRQWDQFQSTGLKCAFINSHHHLHSHPFVYRVLRETVAENFNGWFRMGRPCAFQPTWRTSLAFSLGDFFFRRRRNSSAWRSPDTLWGIDRTFHMRHEEVQSATERLSGGFHEFLFHPRSLDCPDTKCLVYLKKVPPS